MRNSNQSNTRSSSSSYASPAGLGASSQQPYNSSSGFRGNRGSYSNRAGNLTNVGGYNRGGFQQPMTSGFQGAAMGGFQSSPLGAMQQYNGFPSRGNIMGGMRNGQMGTRGGRGAMSPSPMMAMPMGGMGMGGMPGQMGSMAMGMPQMAAGMGMQGMQGYFTYPPNSTASLAGQPTAPSYPMVASPVSSWAYNVPTVQGGLGQGNTIYSARYPSTTPVSFTAEPNTQGENVTLKRQASQSGSAGFQGPQAHYNPAFFQQQPIGQTGGAGDSAWNPHGAKRTRQE